MLPYERILRVTLGLSKATLNLSKHKKKVILRTSLFTVEAKDNIDKNSRCTISKSHCHGISLSLFQFPSTLNLGIEKYYEKYIKVSSRDSRKVRELLSFYTESEEVKHSTANIPDKKATVLTDEKK